jgi:hypothetical protein
MFVAAPPKARANMPPTCPLRVDTEAVDPAAAEPAYQQRNREPAHQRRRADRQIEQADIAGTAEQFERLQRHDRPQGGAGQRFQREQEGEDHRSRLGDGADPGRAYFGHEGGGEIGPLTGRCEGLPIRH